MCTLEGKSPILWSIVYGSLELTETLILTGSDVNAVDEEGKTIIHNLISFEDLSIERFEESLKLLLKHGADINYNIDIEPPLLKLLSASEKKLAKIDLLIEYGADVQLAIDEGNNKGYSKEDIDFLKLKVS